MTTIAPQLRPYQVKARTEILKKLAEGKKRLVVSCPTGGGKGLMMADLINGGVKKGKKSLTILYGQDLIQQTAVNYKRYYDINSQLIMGGLKSKEQLTIIASISTLTRRNLPHVDFIIIDECHQTNSASYEKIFLRYPDAIIIGFSATPINNLTQFEDYIILATVQELIDLGYLVKPRQFIKKTIDTSKVKLVRGEFDEEELTNEALKVTGDIVTEYNEFAKGRSGIVFCVNIKHSIEVWKAFNRAGIKALHLHGSMELSERTRAIKALREGRVQILCNVNVLSTGVDTPWVSYIGGARPTHSEILYVQQGGRGLRPYPGKNDCVIVDHANNYSRFGLLTEDRLPVLTPKQPKKKSSDDVAAIKVWACPYCYGCNSGKDLICIECGKPKPVIVREIKKDQGEMIEVTEKRKKKSVADVMPFGKYKGQTISSLPMQQLIWCVNTLREDRYKELHAKLTTELKGRMNPNAHTL